MLNQNDLYEVLIRIGNEPSQIFDIIQRLDLHQPEGYMLYQETIISSLTKSHVVVLPRYEFRLCCPVHPPHSYDFGDPHDIGSIRHAIWYTIQAHQKQRTRYQERLIIGITQKCY